MSQRLGKVLNDTGRVFTLAELYFCRGKDKICEQLREEDNFR
jgi:hypothetical protein